MVRLITGAGQAIRGVVAAVRGHPGVFLGVALAMFGLSLFLPPLVLSVIRKPWTYFAFNPWLSKLPGFLLSDEVPLERKLEFLPKLALFWMNADGPFGSVEWGYSVHVIDVLRILFTSLLFGAFFALWIVRRKGAAACGWGARAGREGGVAGALVSVLGLSTGPCSVMGCGAPVLPVVGLAFAGLSSSTLRLLTGVSQVSAVVVLLGMTAAVAYLGWRVGSRPQHTTPPAAA